MLSNRPYLLRAFYQWIVDSGCNPILVVDANHPQARVPQDYVEGAEIVFNISPAAIRDLQMLNDFVEFKASFSGVIHVISAPIKAILAVYAEENGEGLFFDAEDDVGEESEGTVSKTSIQLQGIDGFAGSHLSEPVITENARSKPFLKLVE